MFVQQADVEQARKLNTQEERTDLITFPLRHGGAASAEQ